MKKITNINDDQSDEAIVMKVIERNLKTIIGEVQSYYYRKVFEPLDKKYNLIWSNCAEAVNNSLIAAGVNTNNDPTDSFFEQINPFKYLGDNIIPATMYKNIKDANKGCQELNWIRSNKKRNFLSKKKS